MRPKHNNQQARRGTRGVPTPLEARAAAQEAGLHYVNDQAPGIVRRRAGQGFGYRDCAGRSVRDRATLRRIKRLAIPPVWTDVWISPSPNGHIQATGRDARGRKQYRYHPGWSAVRDGAKFERTIAFGRSLPAIRRQVAKDLRRPALDRRKVLAAMVRLLETTLVRIGNEEYAQQNGSFGLSTMRDRHVRVGRGRLHFDFRGKSGRRHEIDLHDPRLAKIVRGTQELPGQDLFQYVGEDGTPQKVTSTDVNDYLREIAGEEFSAKDFRTWAGTVLAAVALQGMVRAGTKAPTKKNLVAAVARVAARLGNTPAVCRKCYIHPLVMEHYLDGVTIAGAEAAVQPEGTTRMTARVGTKLSPVERAVLTLLRRGRPAVGEKLAESIRAERAKRAMRRAA